MAGWDEETLAESLERALERQQKAAEARRAQGAVRTREAGAQGAGAVPPALAGASVRSSSGA